jgi:uncharacterized membrane protein YbhN (UPF0104 family)
MADSSPAGPRRLVEVVDAPRTRVRRPGDLIGLVLAVLGIGVVLLLAVFAHGTTEGVTEDVQSAVARILRGLVQVPVSILEVILAICLPWIVLVERLVHRAFRQVLEAGAASILAALTAGGAYALLAQAPATIAQGFTITTGGETLIAISPSTAALAAFLTGAGSRDQRASVAWSWNLFGVGLVLAVIQNELTLPGALVTLLIGRVVGLAVRYASGVYNERAYGTDLVEGIRRAGLDPVRVVRVSTVAAASPRAVLAQTAAPIGYTEHRLALAAVLEGDGRPPQAAETPERRVRRRPHRRDGVGYHEGELLPWRQQVDPSEIVARAADPATLALEQPGQGRVYAVTDAEGTRWDVVALDGDRQVIGWLASVWSSLRLRGFDRRAVVSLRQAAERASLMSYAAAAAGVRTPALAGLAEVEDSVILAYDHLDGGTPLAELAADDVTEAVLADAWAQLRRAHAAGLAHRDLTAQLLLVRGEKVAILGWTNGDVASSELARRLDLAQMLALLAVRVGVPRAVDSAAQVLEPALLAAIAPLLQPVALPGETRASMRGDKKLLNDLRSALIERLPVAAEAEPVQLARFSARTVVTATIAVAAVWLLLSSLNIGQLTEAIQNANPVWAAAAFVLGLITYVGAAMALMAFSPTRLTFWRTTLVQAAASVVALVAPAGVGPAATNLRYLNRRKVDTPLAVASVALIQVSQFVTTVALLLLIALLTGSGGTLQMPGPAALVAAGAVIALVGAAMAVPRVRAWVWAKAAPTLRQVWPRVLWVVGQPGRLGFGLLGNLIMTGGFIAAFAASIAAFGQEVPLTQLAIIYLGGTALGSAVPTPGGLGTVELALSGGLTAAGIPPAVAASIAVLFRVLTFWGRIPVGWLAMRYLQRKNDL